MSQTEEKNSEKSKKTSEELYLELTKLSELEKVEKLASLFFSPTQIAFYMGYDVDEFRNEIRFKPTEPEAAAYHRGTITTQILLRMETLRFAKAGSAQAEKDMIFFLATQKENENG